MKKFLNVILIVFIMMPAIMLAKHPNELLNVTNFNLEQKQECKATALATEASPLFNSIKVNIKPNVNLLDAATPVIDISGVLGGQPSEMGLIRNYNFTYEPYTKTLFTVVCSRSRDTTLPADYIRKRGLLYYSVPEEGKPLGSKWARTILYDSAQPRTSTTQNIHEWRYPTIAATNPKKSDKFEDIHIGFNCVFYEKAYNEQGLSERKKWFIYTNGRNILDSVEATEYNDTEPGMNNDDGYVFGYHTSLKGHGATINDKPYALFITKAYKKNAASESPSSYAFVGLDLSAKNANTCLNKTQLLPPSIMKNNTIYSDAIMASQNNLSRPAVVDYDDKGNIYFAFCQATAPRYSNPEGYKGWKDLGIPLVIKAPYNDAKDAEIDFGTTPNVNQMPLKVILDYMIAQDGLPDTTDQETAPYFGLRGTGIWDMQFCVNGEDNYSFILAMNFKAGDSKKYQMVEAAYNKGQWSLRHISNIDFTYVMNKDEGESTNNYMFLPLEYGVGKYKGQDVIFAESQENFYENQISRTADGKYYVAKWINCGINDNKPISQKFTVYHEVYKSENTYDTLALELDSIPFARMYLSYRHIDSNKWSKPVEACFIDSLSMQRTIMPKVVPSITEIPIVFWVSLDQSKDFPEYYAIQATVHPVVRHTFHTYAGNWLVISNAVTGFNGITEGEVAEEYRLGNAYPNPSSNIINFEFSLLAPAYTKLTITNALGQTVATVVDQFCNANEYKVDFNTSKLPNGTYYYTLTSGSKVETKMFNVIK